MGNIWMVLLIFGSSFAGLAGRTSPGPPQFAHMAAIGYEDEGKIVWQCGGILVSKKYVLTAAGCVITRSGPPKYVRLGDLNLSDETDDADAQNFTIAKIIPHPLYKTPVKYHDIALIELDKEATLTQYVDPARLNEDIVAPGSTLVAAGWGRTGFSGNPSDILLKVNLDYVPHNACVERFGKYPTQHLPNGIQEDSQICAGGVVGRDTCQGDTGGPLQKLPEEGSSIVGIISFGKACGLSTAPGIYTRVSYYVPWIKNIVSRNGTQN